MQLDSEETENNTGFGEKFEPEDEFTRALEKSLLHSPERQVTLFNEVKEDYLVKSIDFTRWPHHLSDEVIPIWLVTEATLNEMTRGELEEFQRKENEMLDS